MAITLTPINGTPSGGPTGQPQIDTGTARIEKPNPVFTGQEIETTLFIGKNANTVSDLDIEVVEDLAGPNKTQMATVFNDTGWFLGLDGEWRKEIDDSQASLDLDFEGVVNLGDVLNHPELLEAYPAIKNIRFLRDDRLDKRLRGYYDDEINTIGVNPNVKPSEALELIIHELQHVIQEEEGFHKGGFTETKETKDIFEILKGPTKPSDADLFDIYQSFGGEAEARAASRRITLTPTERGSQHPRFSFDVRDVDVLETEKLRSEVLE